MGRLIDADALWDWSEIVPLTDDGGIDINDFEEKLNSMPTVDAEPVRHGRWVEEVTDDGKGFPRTEYTCPFCQYKTRADTNYCPECGERLS